MTAQQLVKRYNWTLYGICVATGLRDKMRFRWNTEDPEFEDGAIELRIYMGKGNKYRDKKWWTYGEDFTLGLTMEGQWYAYAWHCEDDRHCGPVTYETHLGDFPGFETAFFAVVTAIAKDFLDNMLECRAERAMERKFKDGMDSLQGQLTKHFDKLGKQ